jgi:hypothetical protein
MGASFEDIAALAPQHRPILAALRALLRELHPEAVETASLGDRAVLWGWRGGRGPDAYAYATPYARHVNLGFFQGARLPDPARRLEGTGKLLRHVKLRDPAAVADPALCALLLAARDERRAALTL